MRTVLIGAVESTRVALDVLVANGIPPLALVTLPVEKSRRHSDWVDFGPIAVRCKVPVLRVENVNAPEVVARLSELDPEYVLVIGWSQICKPNLLQLPSVGCIGYHPAPLPENRGRGVIPWTILQGRRDTGATLFWMDEGMDSGDILAQERFAVSEDETARTLYDRHLDVLRLMLTRVLPQLELGNAPRVRQDATRATYCARRTANDGLITWEQPARTVWTLIRAVGDPYPGAFTFRRREILTVWDAELIGPAPYCGLPGQVQAITSEGAIVQCGDGEHLRLGTVQVEGEGKQQARHVVRLHERLGIDWLDLARTLRPDRS